LSQDIDEDRGLQENLSTIIAMYNLLLELKAVAGETWEAFERSLP
jgi:hypothetical protein